MKKNEVYTDAEDAAKKIKELKEYATHKNTCQIKSAGFLIAEEKRVCTCGLTETINKH